MLLLVFHVGAETWSPLDHPVSVARHWSLTVRPYDQVEIRAQQAGTLVSWQMPSTPSDAVEESAKWVVAGLLKNDHLPPRLALAQSEHAAAKANQAMTKLLIDERSAEWTFRHKQMELLKKHKIGERELNEAVLAEQLAAIAIKRAKLEEQVATLAVQQAEQSVRAVEAEMAGLPIRVPVGYVAQGSSPLIGRPYQAGDTIINLQDVRKLIGRAIITSADLVLLKRSQSVDISLANGSTIPGAVQTVAVAEGNLLSIDVVFEAAHATKAGVPAHVGMAADLVVQQAFAGGGVMIPKRFLIQRGQQYLVRSVKGNQQPVDILEWRKDQAVVSHHSVPKQIVLP